MLGEPIQCRFQKFGLNIEEVVRVLERGEGVVLATVALDELLVFARIGVFLGPKEQHVLEEVGEAFALRRIISATNSNVH